MISYKRTAIVQLKHSIFEQAGVQLLVKREDQNHPLVSGNKWWKLKYNLEETARQGQETLLTFGGAYSNHLCDTAASAQQLKLRSIGVVRGEKIVPLNPTLQFAVNCGMNLHFVSREMYKRKTEDEFMTTLHEQWGDFYLIPEGGTNDLAVKGCAEFAGQLISEASFDYLCLPVGTGGTMAGLINGFGGKKKVIGFPALKGARFLEDEIKKFSTQTDWQLVYDYHFGGYAKSNVVLLDFIRWAQNQFNLPLDYVYTGKMMFGVFDLIKKGFFPAGARILAIHTGGLQASISDHTAQPGE